MQFIFTFYNQFTKIYYDSFIFFLKFTYLFHLSIHHFMLYLSFYNFYHNQISIYIHFNSFLSFPYSYISITFRFCLFIQYLITYPKHHFHFLIFGKLYYMLLECKFGIIQIYRVSFFLIRMFTNLICLNPLYLSTLKFSQNNKLRYLNPLIL